MSGEKDVRERLIAFYEHYEPSKVGDIDKIMKKYAGNEDKLFRALIRKYGPEPERAEEEEVAPPPPPPATAAPEPAAKSETYEEALSRMFKERLVTFYTQYDESKVTQVDTLLTKYSGKEEQLFKALVKKYGPEPTPADDGDDDEDEEGEQRGGAAEDSGSDDDGSDDDDEGPGVPSVAPGRDAEEKSEAIEMDGAFRRVVYCGVCGLPPDYCEYGPDFERCKVWIEQHAAWALGEDDEDEEEGDDGDKKKKKKSKRGGQGPKKKVLFDESKQQVVVSMSSRGGKKVVTHVVGLEYFPNLKLKEAAKSLGKRFACSTSVKDTPTGEKEIQIQGDVQYEIEDVLESLFKITPDKVTIKEEKKKKKEPKKPPPQPGPRRDD